MIAADRVRLDDLIHQWEEEAERHRHVVQDSGLWSGLAWGLQTAAEQLRAALLVLGDARPPQPADDWTPAVLTEYEIGRAVWAAEIIAKCDKPITEIGSRAVASRDALENDLRECLKLASEATDVKIWMRSDGGQRVRYGFYRDAWVTGALDFLDRAELPDVDRAWINGLLFGYRSDAIQRFINRLTASITTG